MLTLEDLPLRPKKYALTKVGLLRAAMERLDDRTLEELQVRELCEVVAISEASFFNYFPRKADLLVYFIQLWTVDVAWHATIAERDGKTLREAIGRIFEVTAVDAARHPGLMGEVLASQARLRESPALADITLAERLVAFPGRPGIDEVPARGLDSILPDLLARAVQKGELPRGTDIASATLGLASIFFGVPMILIHRHPSAIAAAYQTQLDTYWAGLGQPPRSRSKPSTQRRKS